MNQDKYLKIKENFNNFLANRAPGMEEQEGNTNMPNPSPTEDATPDEILKNIETIVRNLNIGVSERNAELKNIDKLRQILSTRGQMKEERNRVKGGATKKKEAKKFTKKEVDAYKADHAKDSKGNFIKKDFKKK